MFPLQCPECGFGYHEVGTWSPRHRSTALCAWKRGGEANQPPPLGAG